MGESEAINPTSMITESSVHAGENAELPEFLEGDEVPKGYKVVELGPGESLLISVDLTPGSETVCYAGNVGVVLTRGITGKIYFRLAGLDFPKDIFPYDEGDPGNTTLTNLGPEGIPLGFKVRRVHLSEGRDVLGAVGSHSSVLVKVPSEVKLGGKTAGTAVLSGLSTVFSLGFDLKLGSKEVEIYIDSNAYGIHQKVVVPTAAVFKRAAAGGEDE